LAVGYLKASDSQGGIMKAVKIYQAGGPEQLIYQDVPTPDIKEGWSLVKIKGFSINHSEIFTREGKSPSVSFHAFWALNV